MFKHVLYIPRPGSSSKIIQNGYVDTLRSLGWKVYVCDPKTKLGCQTIIEKYNISLIMTHSKYGTRQLPVDTINDNRIAVAVEVLPLNDNGLTIDGPYECSRIDEPALLRTIDNIVIHTRIEPCAWHRYMTGWTSNDIKFIHLPVAGNMINALPPTCSVMTDVAMVANFSHRPEIFKNVVAPLFARVDLLGYSYQAFGDELWHKSGLQYSGPFYGDTSQLAHIYASAKICPNVHTEIQVRDQICLNERSFMIPLCGGLQVSDNPLATKYLGLHCEVATSVTDFIQKTITEIDNQYDRTNRIKLSAEHVSHNHTYFNRLSNLFTAFGLEVLSDETRDKGRREATKHCWGLDARLSAYERGIDYGKQNIGTS